MNKNVGEQVMRGTYQLVGSVLDPRTVELNIEAANELYNYVSGHYLLPMLAAYPTKGKVELSDAGTGYTMMAGSTFGPHPNNAPDLEISGFTGVRLVQEVDDWRLRIITNRQRHDGTPNKVATHYSVDVAEGIVLQARREVRVVRSRSDDFFNQLLEDDSVAPAKEERKAFQRPLTVQDFEPLQVRLRQAANRALALA